jgi:hypothetical protein
MEKDQRHARGYFPDQTHKKETAVADILVLYALQSDSGRAARFGPGKADSAKMKFRSGAGEATIDEASLPVAADYNILMFFAHGRKFTRQDAEVQVREGFSMSRYRAMSNYSGYGRMTTHQGVVSPAVRRSQPVSEQSIANVIKRYNPRFVMFFVCYMGRGHTLRLIYEHLRGDPILNHTCLLCADKDSVMFSPSRGKISLLGNSFYGNKDGGAAMQYDGPTSVGTFTSEFNGYF